MKPQAELDMDVCCTLVVQHCRNPYAEAYARAWLDGRVQARAEEYGTSLEQARRIQANYILSNLDWSGPQAAQVRDSLRKLAR